MQRLSSSFRELAGIGSGLFFAAHYDRLCQRLPDRGDYYTAILGRKRMRLAVITDVHGNLPALEAALAAVDHFGVDLLVHTGDAVGIGPYPRECVEVLSNRPATHCLLGNHDAWYAFGLPQPRPEWMGVGEWEHQQWTHAALGDALRSTVASWQYSSRLDSAAGPIELLHFPRNDDGEFLMPSLAPKTGEAADALFGEGARFVFYGHHHEAADLVGAATRYINPGSLGCAAEAVARVAFLVIESAGQWQLSLSAIPYHPAGLFEEFDRRGVPERDFIRRVFMPFAKPI
jgi:predicted phosphodiesterase